MIDLNQEFKIEPNIRRKTIQVRPMYKKLAVDKTATQTAEIWMHEIYFFSTYALFFPDNIF